jgi:hypothetical protein
MVKEGLRPRMGAGSGKRSNISMMEDSKDCHSQNPSAVNWNPLFCETCTKDSSPRPVVNPVPEGLTMAKKKVIPSFQLGDLVRIPHYSNRRAKIVELRGALGPGGKQVYRVIVRRKPSPVYIELTEDEVVPIPAKE